MKLQRMDSIQSLPRNEKVEEFVAKVLDELFAIASKQLPILQEITLKVIHTVFCPKVIGQQLGLLVALEVGVLSMAQLTLLVNTILGQFSTKQRLIRQLEQQQREVALQDDWMALAEQIDQVQANDVWRSNPDCPLYERDRISSRVDELVHLMRRGDVFELMFVLRGSIGRKKFGLLHEGLFSKALAGTKVLVETYHNVVCASLDYCCDATVANDDIPTDARLAFFNETRHAYGRTALLLSGGAALGFYHTGVCKTLMENRLFPRVMGGSSAGSLVCAMVATRTDQECMQDLFNAKGTVGDGHSGELPLDFFRPLSSGAQQDAINTSKNENTQVRLGGIREVYNNTAGFFTDAKRTLQGLVPIPLRHISALAYDVITGNRRPQDVLMNDTEHFRSCVRKCVGNFTFQEAFDRTGRILNIVVTPKNNSDPPRLLNYLTAPHVLVWSAAVASCSLPGVFEPNRLVVKEADGWERFENVVSFSDGSMEQDLPMQQLSEMFNVNHFLISQANPHAVMFATQPYSVWDNKLLGGIHAVMKFLRDQTRSWLLNLVECLGARSISPMFQTQRGIGASFFTQEYTGRSCDISLIPWASHRSLFSAILHIIYNPSEAEFREWIQAAERETWKHIPAIKSHIAEEATLDRCVQRLRKRLVQESWEKQSNQLGGRVPSFFTSPSLVNLGGLNVSDQPTVEGLHDRPSSTGPSGELSPLRVVEDVDLINSGWNGRGLSGNLSRNQSDGSGLFIDDEVSNRSISATPPPPSLPPRMGMTPPPLDDRRAESDGAEAYVKSTSMAKFYYRRAPGTSSGEDLLTLQSKSDHHLDEADGAAGATPRISHHKRRKSKSHTDLSTTVL